MLIVIGGLPGVGKTTLSRALARGWEGTRLVIDTSRLSVDEGVRAIRRTL